MVTLPTKTRFGEGNLVNWSLLLAPRRVQYPRESNYAVDVERVLAVTKIGVRVHHPGLAHCQSWVTVQSGVGLSPLGAGAELDPLAG